MIVTIHQPQYLPWLGYFDKINSADIFVLLDDVQYKKNEWQNRNKIRIANGWQWITVPVKYKFGQKTNQVKIDNNRDWQKNHYKSLVINYNKATYFKNYEPFFETTYNTAWEYLVDINIHFIEHLVALLGITTKLVRASQLKLKGQKTKRLVNICRELEASIYLSGRGGKEYLVLNQFEREGIEVLFQDFRHPIYRQAYNNFEPFMSVVDLLFNYGHKSLEVLKGGDL